MTPDSDRLEIRCEGRTTIITYAGNQPFSADEENRARFLEASTASKFIVIDIGGHESFDWNDLYLLLAARRAHRARWGFHMNLFKIVARPGKHRAMIEAMHMEHVLSTYRSLREALATLPRRRALHIEPDDDTAAVIELLLEANGFEVIRLTRAGTLPLSEREVPFDIVLTEVDFGGAVDRDVVRRLRVEFSCPVGVLTARAQDRVDRIDGAAFVLAKPIVPDLFLERVSHALERPLHQYYEAIFDMLDTPICLADGKGLVVRYNRAWGNLFRLPPSEEAGREIASAFPRDVPAPEILARLLAVARHARKDEILIETAGADGGPRTRAVSFAAIGTQAGESHVLMTVGGDAEPESLMPQARAALLSLLEDLDAARIEVSRANERLLGLDRMKSDFLSTVSHELRTPIAVIKGSVENLLDGLLGEMDARQKATFEIVLRNARRLARLIENLLDLSHIERGSFEIQRREIDLAETVRFSVEEIQPVARKMGIALDLDLPAEAVPLAADADRIGQVVINLLDNALRFARTRVWIRLEAEGDNGRIVVEDDGPGVPAEDIGGIFERFTRVRNHGHLSHTGLGLSIVRAIAEGHGGRVWAENRADGGGGRFTVLLPLSREAPAGAAR